MTGCISHSVPETDAEKQVKLGLVARQTKQLHKTGSVSCECGRTGKPWAMMYKCFYCGVFLCHPCAKVHFSDNTKDHQPSEASAVNPLVEKEEENHA